MYKINITKKVFKFLSKHKGEKLITSFENSLIILKNNPYRNTLDIKSLKWYEKNYRLRIWKYRFIYEIIEDKLIISFAYADTRWNIY